jgi:hypothetical protein
MKLMIPALTPTLCQKNLFILLNSYPSEITKDKIFLKYGIFWFLRLVPEPKNHLSYKNILTEENEGIINHIFLSFIHYNNLWLT